MWAWVLKNGFVRGEAPLSTVASRAKTRLGGGDGFGTPNPQMHKRISKHAGFFDDEWTAQGCRNKGGRRTPHKHKLGDLIS